MVEFFPIPFFLGLSAFLAVVPILWRRKWTMFYWVCFALFWMYLLAVVSVTIFPIPISDNLLALWTKGPFMFTLAHINLLPFNYFTFFNKYVVVRELVRNVILTIPFGIGIPFLMPLNKKERFWLALAPGLWIEAAQLLVSLSLAGTYRAIDITDVILNTLGVWIGYALFHLLALKLQSSPFLNYQLPITPLQSPPITNHRNNSAQSRKTRKKG